MGREDIGNLNALGWHNEGMVCTVCGSTEHSRLNCPDAAAEAQHLEEAAAEGGGHHEEGEEHHQDDEEQNENSSSGDEDDACN